MTKLRGPRPDLDLLIGLFYDQPRALGHFEEVSDREMPSVYRQLLAHEEHMTVTVESFHGCPVDVKVLECRLDPGYYSRRILLNRQRDGQVVQFGIVRLHLEFLEDDVRREIERQETPLGRVLIRHNVLRHVELSSLWRITPGPDLQQLFELSEPTIVYGRTAWIYCNGEPAVELLEIVTPVDDGQQPPAA